MHQIHPTTMVACARAAGWHLRAGTGIPGVFGAVYSQRACKCMLQLASYRGQRTSSIVMKAPMSFWRPAVDARVAELVLEVMRALARRA